MILVVLHCSNRNDLVMILDFGHVVELVARLVSSFGVRVQVVDKIDVKVDKKQTIVIHENSIDGFSSYQKRGVQIAAVEAQTQRDPQTQLNAQSF